MKKGPSTHQDLLCDHDHNIECAFHLNGKIDRNCGRVSQIARCLQCSKWKYKVVEFIAYVETSVQCFHKTMQIILSFERHLNQVNKTDKIEFSFIISIRFGQATELYVIFASIFQNKCVQCALHVHMCILE